MTSAQSSVRGAFSFLRRSAIAGLLAILFAAGMAQAESAEQKVNALPNGIAMDGFDVVAYFGGAPAHGSEAHSVTYKDKTWLFSSAENAQKFSAAPAQYEPQFNGFCSYAVSEAYGAEVDFVNGWAVIDGKLYLNWDEETKDAFVAEQSTRLDQAHGNWSAVHSGLKDGSTPLYTHAGEGVDIPHPQPLN